MRLASTALLAVVASACSAGVYHPERSASAAEVAVSVDRGGTPGADSTILVANTEVTQREYAALVGRNPAYHDDCPDCPVERVSWYDAAAYANARSAAEGLPACYVLEGCSGPGEAPSGWRRRRDAPTPLRCDSARSLGPSCAGYRLPTRVESDAIRADRSMLATRRSARRHAVYGRGSADGPSAVVASRTPDARGLYDLFGNVDEWLDDPARRPDGVRGPNADETRWYGTAGGCALANLRRLRATRWIAEPAALGRICLGFRLVRTR